MRVIGSERAIDFTVLGKPNDFLGKISEKAHMYTYSSGRNAIYNLMKHLACKRILFPDFYCPSMLIPLKMAKKSVIFYRINRHFSAVKSDYENKLRQCDVVFIADYFGQRDLWAVDTARHGNKTIIIDRTHSLLGTFDVHGDYEIASMRKLFPVPDGGIVISHSGRMPVKTTKRRTEEFTLHKTYAKILRYMDEHINHSPALEQYYVQYSQSSEQSMQLGDYDISPLSLHIVNHYPVDTAIKNRKRNYQYLHKHMDNHACMPIEMPPVPQSMPIYINRRSRIKKYMERWGIYAPVLWRSSKSYASQLLNLPIDEEYSNEDMKRLIKVLRNGIRDTV